jgi:hypothetical protein
MDGVTAKTEVYQLRIALREISPAIWRRVLVRSDRTIEDLHYTLQLVMGWGDLHLNRFIIHGKDYGVYHDGGISFGDDPRTVRLADFRFRVKERFLYEYDFGDLWQHDIRLERKLPVDPKRIYPVCIGGRRACPPEDCGGPWAFMELEHHYSIFNIVDRLEEIIEDEDDDIECYREELDECCQWLKKEHFDRRQVNRRLKQYALDDEAWMWALSE